MVNSLTWKSVLLLFRVLRCYLLQKYLDFYTHGFRELPTPAQLRASLADKPTIEELQDEFRRFTKTRVSNEILQFYAEVLDRDTVEDYFERQAVTMTIIDRYVRPDSCDQVRRLGFRIYLCWDLERLNFEPPQRPHHACQSLFVVCTLGRVCRQAFTESLVGRQTLAIESSSQRGS